MTTPVVKQEILVLDFIHHGKHVESPVEDTHINLLIQSMSLCVIHLKTH
jgi:hypothetical protein